MKKVKMIIIVTLALCAALTAQTEVELVATETFDTYLPIGWAQSPPFADNNDWHQGIFPGGGTNCAWVNYETDNDDSLFTPSFDASAGFDSIIVEMLEDYELFGATGSGSSYILVSGDGGATWETAETYGRNQIVTTVNRYHIEAYAHSGPGSKVCFWYDNNDDEHWAIDNMTIYGYTPIPEPAPPAFSHRVPPKLYPYGTTELPILLYTNDFTGVYQPSVEICFRLNTYPFECHGMTYDGGLPDGTGNYTYTIPDLYDWRELDYYFRARDTYSPASVGSSMVYSTLIEGPYFIYEDNTGYPMSPDTHWVPGSTLDLDVLEADDVFTFVTSLPFPITFFGRDFDTLWLSSNGWLQLSGEGPGGTWFWSEYIPTVGGLMNNIIAWCWDDLTGLDFGSWDPQAYYYEDPAGDYIIVSFVDWGQLGYTSSAFSCQIQIWSPDAIPQPGGNCAIDVRFNGLPATLYQPEMGVENNSGEVGIAYMHVGGFYGDPEYTGFTFPQRTIRYTSQPPPGGVIWGNVDLADRTDDSGAKVGIVGMPFFDFTSITGNYIISHIPAGTYDIYCYHPSFHPETTYDVIVVEEDTVELNFTLETRTVGYAKGFADLTDGPPIGDAGITITEVSSGISTITEAGGYFFLDGIPTGSCQIIATYPGYILDYTPVFELAMDDTIDMDVIHGMLELDLLIPLWEEDFEGDDGGGVTSGGPLWEWGTPMFVGPPGAHSGTLCWGTDLDDYYFGGTVRSAIDILDVPVPGIVPGPTGVFNLWHWYETEEYMGDMEDGGNIWISTDGGTSWEFIADPDPDYTAVIDPLYGNPMGGEAGYGLGPVGWEKVSFDISGYPVITNIRFRFGTDDYPSSDAGWYIDDLSIIEELTFTGVVEGYVYDCNTYETIDNATVCLYDRTVLTDAAGYYIIDDVPYGNGSIWAVKSGYFPGFEDIDVFVNDTVLVLIAICSIDLDSITGHLAYGEDDSIYFEICNPTNDTIFFQIPPLPFDLSDFLVRDEVIEFDVGPNPDDPNAKSREPVTTPDRARPRDMGDVWITYDVSAGPAMAWGLGLLPDNFWVSDPTVYQYDHIFSRPSGDYTGLFFDVTGIGGSDWMADMCWDGIRGVVWQLAVGGTNGLYAIDPTTGAVVDALSDPIGIWDNVSQRGVAFDPDEDVFYIGGWTDELIYKVKGLSWDNPGATIEAFDAPGCAGVGYHRGRNTIWFAVNDTVEIVAEIDPATNTIINTIVTPAPARWYSLAGLEIDELGRIWVVDMNENAVYVLEGPVDGMYVVPGSGNLAPGECITFALINEAWVTQVGDYCFDVNFYYGDFLTPYSIPTCVQVQPRAYKGWELITVPLDATPNDPYIQFVDDITPFSVDPSFSNIYGYNQDAGLLELPPNFVRGKGYYLKTWLDRTYWDVYGTPFADGDFTYTMYYPEDSSNWGWWLIGNPFNRRTNWDDVYAANDFTYIEPEYWNWSQRNGWSFYSPIVGGGGEDELIDAWRGYFINIKNGNPAYWVNLLYPAEGTMETFLAKVKGGGVQKGKAVKTDNPAEFALRLSVLGISGMDVRHDTYNYFSVNEEALDGYDIYDIREPAVTPPAGNLSSFFVNGAFRLAQDTKDNFADTSKTWTFKVENLPSGMAVTLMWPRNRVPTGDDQSCGVENLDSRWGLSIEDMTTGETIDMRVDTSYNFIFSSGARLFTITLTDDGALDVSGVEKPEVFNLGPNIPNPFNATTEFEIAIPHDTDVKVEVFNLLGKRVTTLVDGEMKTGWHRVIWNGLDNSGRELPSGVYLYRVIAGDFNETKKMTLVK